MMIILDMNQHIANIEDAINDYMQSGQKNEDDFKQKIANSLSIITSTSFDDASVLRKFEIFILKNQDTFSGVTVFPSISYMKNLGVALAMQSCEDFNNRWSNCKSFVVEFDNNLFDRNVINFNPSEIVALLMHEISHVVFTSKTAERIYHAYKKYSFTIDSYSIDFLKNLTQLFGSIPIGTGCTVHNWSIDKNRKIKDYICDQMFGMDPSQENLLTAINKVIKTYGNSYIESETSKNGKIERAIKWMDLNIKDTNRRKDQLRSELFYEAAAHKSPTMRAIYLAICNQYGLNARDRYTNKMIGIGDIITKIDDGLASIRGICMDYTFFSDPKLTASFESALKISSMKPAMEGSKNKAVKLPSEYDIDAISIEIDRMENHHDRIYVLDLIYAKIEQINNFKEYCELTGQKNRYDAKIKKMLTELEMLRQAVLRKHDIGNKSYGVFVKYPRNYEG